MCDQPPGKALELTLTKGLNGCIGAQAYDPHTKPECTQHAFWAAQSLPVLPHGAFRAAPKGRGLR
eukprot:209668-Alexandrium_andersonii.AAC.1